MPSQRLDLWLTFLAVLLFVALLALIANAQTEIPTSLDLDQELAFEAIEGETGEFMVIRWDDGREVHIRLTAVNIIRYYPAGHEAGERGGAIIELQAMGNMQRIMVDPDLAEKLIRWGHRKRLIGWDSDGNELTD